MPPYYWLLWMFSMHGPVLTTNRPARSKLSVSGMIDMNARKRRVREKLQDVPPPSLRR